MVLDEEVWLEDEDAVIQFFPDEESEGSSVPVRMSAPPVAVVGPGPCRTFGRALASCEGRYVAVEVIGEIPKTKRLRDP